MTSLVRSRSNQLSVSPWDAALKKKPVQSSLISVTHGTRIFKCDYISLYLHNWAVLQLCIVFSIGESPRVCAKYLSRCDRIPFESKGALSVNFSSIAIELKVPRDEFSSIAIEPTVSVALRRGFKKSRFNPLWYRWLLGQGFLNAITSVYICITGRCYGCV